MFTPGSVRIHGPLKPHFDGFWAALLQQGYTQQSARYLLFVMAHIDRWLDDQRLDLRDLTEEAVAAFLRYRSRKGHKRHRTPRALEPLLCYLRSIGTVPMPTPVQDETPVGQFVREYAAYLARERGLAARTVSDYADFARQFIEKERRRLDWERLSAADVSRFVLRRARHSSRRGCRSVVASLRSLLRFLHVSGATPHDLSSAVPAVAGWRLSGLPKALDVTQVERLLASFDRSPVGLRDAAIVLLLLRLGLRAGEVAALGLDDVDWRAGEIAVHGKGRNENRLPLPPDVGRAVADYLRHSRPRTRTRSLFLRVRAPRTAITPLAVAHVAGAALRRSGTTEGGAHLLRHTAATQLLRGGASLSEIAHVLRHRHVDTTAIYAKVDLDSLRALVRPWPGGTP